jgi:hypothetical protein
LRADKERKEGRGKRKEGRGKRKEGRGKEEMESLPPFTARTYVGASAVRAAHGGGYFLSDIHF